LLTLAVALLALTPLLLFRTELLPSVRDGHLIIETDAPASSSSMRCARPASAWRATCALPACAQ